MTLSADDFSALEERILRAVNLVKRERQARADGRRARQRRRRRKLREQAPLVEQLQKEVNALRAERDHVRQRVERLLCATGRAGTVRSEAWHGSGAIAAIATGYVTVEIYDQTYHLSGQDAEHIRGLAELVDARMRAVAAQGRTVDSLRVAVLAALNLADELSQARRRRRRCAAGPCARGQPARAAGRSA